jgi:phosphoribosylformylglycinamidine (FGAM) synthase-like enzyme
VRGVPPLLDLDAEHALQRLLVTLANDRLMRSAHDCSDGGLAVTIAECAFETLGIGAEVSLEGIPVSRDAHVNIAAALFGESASRVIVSVVPEQVTSVLRHAAAAGVLARVIGQTGGSRLRIAVAGASVIDQSVDEAERVWSTAIDRYFVQRVA